MDASYEARDGYLYLKVTGEFGLSAVRDILLEGVERARRHALNRALCDITLITGFDAEETSTMTRFDASRLVAEWLPTDFMVAILETPRQHAGDPFGENVMVNRGATVKVTSELNEALAWLRVAAAP